LLFDIDGVLIWHEKSFPLPLSAENYIEPSRILNEFHEGLINIECDRGIKDPLHEIKPYLAKIRWEYDSKEYFDRQYEFESQYIDFELLNKIKNIRRKGIKLFIGSNQNHYRKQFLIKKMDLNNVFDESYFSCDFGFVKPEKGYWQKVFEKIQQKDSNIMKNDVLFLDDRFENVESARIFGMNAKQIVCKKDVLEVLSTIRT
jgi:FMN phosphatase YigB (HAD superfamily)